MELFYPSQSIAQKYLITVPYHNGIPGTTGKPISFTKCKLGLQYRYQQGKVQVNHNRFMGYTKDEDGHLVIEPTEAEVVKRIYREYLEGSSLLQIGQSLEADGILTGDGKKRWRPETIKKILRNAEYYGEYPCHRVVNYAGRLVPGWLEQGDLLRNEGVTLKDKTHVALKKCQWDG